MSDALVDLRTVEYLRRSDGKRLTALVDDAFLKMAPEVEKRIGRTMEKMATTPEMVDVMESWRKGDFTDWQSKLAKASYSLHVRPERIADALRSSFIEGASVASEASEGVTGFDPNAVTPQAVRWANARAGDLITDIGTTMERNIRAQVSQAVLGDISMDELRSNLASYVRLDPRQADAVRRMRDAQIKQGVPKTRAAKNAREYSKRLRASRAESIASTETMTALNEGVRGYWRAVMEQSGVPVQDLGWKWVCDRAPCPACKKLNNVTIGFEDSFTFDAMAVRTPPAHPRCRCTLQPVYDGDLDRLLERAYD